MVIHEKFFCPECGELWDLEFCFSCEYSDEELVTALSRYRKQPFKEEEKDVYRNGRQGRRKK